MSLIDSPGHSDFSGEVSAALRLSDGAILVVDPADAKGRALCPQTETVLRQALAERVRPVLFLNKMDRLIAEMQLEPEEIYAKFERTIEAVNAIIEEYQPEGMDFTVSPLKGNVAFGSGLEQWAFTLDTFAQLLTPAGGNPAKLRSKLWGAHFKDASTGKWTTGALTGAGAAPLPRGFCQYVVKPIADIFQAAEAEDKARLQKMGARCGVTLSDRDVADARPKDVRRQLLREWLPIAPALLTLVEQHLPSPRQAQVYRAGPLYEGDADDEFVRSMQECNPEGPLMIYVSKLFAATGGKSANVKQLTAYGRVFSGTVRAGDQVYVVGPTYVPGEKGDVFKVKIRDVVTVMGGRTVRAEQAMAGQLVGLEGIDRCLAKTGCVLSDPRAHRLRVMQFSVTPIVQLAIHTDKPGDSLKVVEKLQLLAKSDPCLRMVTNEHTQEIIMAGVGELHLEVRVKDLAALSGVEVRTSKPVVQYAECITADQPVDCVAKSTNGHNALHVRAMPLADELVADLESGAVSMAQAVLERTTRLHELHGWDRDTARRIMAIENGNVLVDSTTGISLADIRENVILGFREVCNNGVVAGEPLRGLRFDVFDAKIHSDPVHRRADSIVPMTRKVLSGAVLTHAPRLVEPVFRVEVTLPGDVMGAYCRVIKQRRGEIIDDIMEGSLHTISAFLPVADAFGLSEDLRGATSGRAFPQINFDHWQIMPEDPTVAGSRTNTIALEARARKGLAPQAVPTADMFLQRLPTKRN